MKKETILIWGTGDVFLAEFEQICKIVDDGIAEVVALVSRDSKEKVLKGFPVIHKEDVLTLQFDKLIIAAVTPAYESILEDVKELGIKLENVFSVHDWFLNITLNNDLYYQDLLQRQGKVLRELLKATDEEVSNYEWMYNKVINYGIYPFKNEGKIFYTELGMMQLVEEFTNYCIFISSLEIKNAIEIGVFRGRSSYFVCALLSRKNPKLKYICVDIADCLDSFEYYKEILPALDKRIPSTSNDYKGESFDYVFIDADHSYDASIRDYMNIGRYANKLVAFHDIYAHEYDELNGGTVRMWNEVVNMTAEKEHKIFSIYPDKWMGIGCVVM